MSGAGRRIDQNALGDLVAQQLARMSREDVIRHRDLAGRKMQKFADIASGKASMSRSDIVAYFGELVAQGDLTSQEMADMLQGLPRETGQIRQWGKMMFATMMWRGVHGHALYPGDRCPARQPGGPQEGAQEVSD